MKLLYTILLLAMTGTANCQATFETNTRDLRPQPNVPQLPNEEMYRALENKQRQYDQTILQQNGNSQAQTSEPANSQSTYPAYNSHFDFNKPHSLYFVKHHPHYYATGY